MCGKFDCDRLNKYTQINPTQITDNDGDDDDACATSR